MQALLGGIIPAFLLVFGPMIASASDSQVTVIDTGSTNRAGMRVTFDREGHATVEVRGRQPQQIKLDEHLCDQLFRDLKAAGPLPDLPVRHCMKSVSFGSSMFVEANGERTPDLSCGGQLDTRAQALQKSATELLKTAQETAGVKPGRTFSAPLQPYPPK